MKFYVSGIENSENHFLQKLTLKILGNNKAENSLYVLPEALKLINNMGLNSYAIQFVQNAYHRYDIEIIAQQPRVFVKENNKAVTMDVLEKYKRMRAFFYGTNPSDAPSHEFDNFHAIEKCLYELKHCSPWSKEELYIYRTEFTELGHTHEELSREKHTSHLNNASHSDSYRPEDDISYKVLKKHSKYTHVAMGSSACPFDREELIKQQGIMQFNYFRMSFNYRPFGDSPLHLMIISNSHTADLATATTAMLFELEILFNLFYKLTENQQDIKIFSQQHATSGMSVPHLHIQLLVKPSALALNRDILGQLQSFAKIMSKSSSIQVADKLPLSPTEMQTKALEYSEIFKKEYEELQFKQARRHMFFDCKQPSPQRYIATVEEKRLLQSNRLKN